MVALDEHFNGVTAVSSTADKSTCSTGFVEVSPGRFFFIYDVINLQDSREAKPANAIRGCYIEVARANE